MLGKRIFVAVAAGAMLLMAGSASAQVGYSGGTPDNTGGNTDTVLGSVTVNPGRGSSSESCLFQANSPVKVTFNGSPAGTTTANGSGCATVATRVLANCRSIRVNGVVRPARQGANSLVLSGPGANGGTRTTTQNVNVDCATDEVKGSLLARTGSELLGLVPWGLGLLALGTGLLFASKRRRSASV